MDGMDIVDGVDGVDFVDFGSDGFRLVMWVDKAFIVWYSSIWRPLILVL